MTVTQARKLFATWRSDQYGYVKRLILLTAYERGCVHADDVSQEANVQSRNIIGAAFNALRSSNLLQSTGEHRKSVVKSTHGRRSYVYRLTERGRSYARIMEVDRHAALMGQPQPMNVVMPGQLRFDALD